MHSPRRTVPSVALLGLLAAVLALPAATAVEHTPTRIAGEDRFATAAALATAAFPSGAEDVVLARGDDFPDALAAAALAGAVEGPILLTASDALPGATRAALDRLGARRVVLLGGPQAVSTAVEGELAAGGLEVDRVAGANRYATAARIAHASEPGRIDGRRAAIVVSGAAFADALAGGPVSYALGIPILLTPRDRLAPETAAALADLDIEQVLLLGGPAAVSAATETAVARIIGRDVQRLFGDNRAGTAGAVYAHARDSLGFGTSFLLTRGDAFPDALATAPYAGQRKTGVLLATGATRLGNATRTVLRDYGVGTVDGRVTALGGPGAVADEVLEAADEARQGRPGQVAYWTGDGPFSVVVRAPDGEVILDQHDPAQWISLGGDTLGTLAMSIPDGLTVAREGAVAFDVLTGEKRFGIDRSTWPIAVNRDVMLFHSTEERDRQVNSLWRHEEWYDGMDRKLVQFSNGEGLPGHKPEGHPDAGTVLNWTASADGATVAFAHGNDVDLQFYDVFVVSASLDQPASRDEELEVRYRQITRNGKSRGAEISPSGDQVVYQHEFDRCGGADVEDPMAMTANAIEVAGAWSGAPAVVLTGSCAQSYYNPRWLDEDRIVVHRLTPRGALDFRSDLVLVEVATGQTRLLAPDLAPGPASVSPSTGKVAYVSRGQDMTGGFTILDPASGRRQEIGEGYRPKLVDDRSGN
jgi:putative cell wall-binding protein